MGGMGSGNWIRYDHKKTVEAALRVDIRFMRRQGILQPGCRGQLSWTSRGEKSDEVRYTCFRDGLLLSFNISRNGGEWQPVKQVINFERMPCRFGGERLWFCCPQCCRRCEVLYLSPMLFVCRLCAGLPYRSQMLGKYYQWMDKRDDLEALLWGNKRKRWRKPKLAQLLDDYQQVDQAIAQNMLNDLNMLKGRIAGVKS